MKQYYDIVHKPHTANSSSATHSTLPFFASVGLDFRFLDYFQMVARCIVQACARRSYTMSPAHIIRPKWQHGVGDARPAGSMHKPFRQPFWESWERFFKMESPMWLIIQITKCMRNPASIIFNILGWLICIFY